MSGHAFGPRALRFMRPAESSEAIRKRAQRRRQAMKWQEADSGHERAKEGRIEASVIRAPDGWWWRVEGCEPEEGGAKYVAAETMRARLFRERVMFAVGVSGYWCDDELIERVKGKRLASDAAAHGECDVTAHRLLDRLGVPAGDLLSRIAKLAAR